MWLGPTTFILRVVLMILLVAFYEDIVRGERKIQSTMSETLLNGAKNPFNYDDFLEHIGQAGPFQRRTTLLLCWPAFFFGIIIMCSTFTGAVPRYRYQFISFLSIRESHNCVSHRCYVDGCETATGTPEFQPQWINHTVPWYQADPTLRQCRRYNHTWIDPAQCIKGSPDVDGSKLIKCHEWVYDTSLFHSTIVTDVIIDAINFPAQAAFFFVG